MVQSVRRVVEVIKLEYSLRLKIKRNDWLLADTCAMLGFFSTRTSSSVELDFNSFSIRTKVSISMQKSICKQKGPNASCS